MMAGPNGLRKRKMIDTDVHVTSAPCSFWPRHHVPVADAVGGVLLGLDEQHCGCGLASQ
jgi:hypothetical protein